MSGPTLTMKAGEAPYEDGSGHKVVITIEQDSPETEPTISIEAVFRMPASDWPRVCATMDRLLTAFGPYRTPQGSETPHE